MPHLQLSIRTDAVRQIVDITDEARKAVHDSGVRDGFVLVAVPHCTCAVYVNENEGGLVEDTLAFISGLAASGKWQHDRIDDNAAAHLVAALMGSSVCLPVVGGAIELGTWQRIMLVELDGPRQRRLTVTAIAGLRSQLAGDCPIKQAVLLVGGLGTRLRPLTYLRPKALVPVMNWPLISYEIQLLALHGVRDIILAVGYAADALREGLGDGSRWGVSLSYREIGRAHV